MVASYRWHHIAEINDVVGYSRRCGAWHIDYERDPGACIRGHAFSAMDSPAV